MNHSLIPLLKFHPEQSWPHREKEGYWGAKWDEGPGDQARQSRPCQSRGSQNNDSPPSSFLLPLFPFPRSSTEGLGTTNSLCMTEKSACSERSAMEGPPQCRGLKVMTDTLAFCSLWPNAGKESSLLLDFSVLLHPNHPIEVFVEPPALKPMPVQKQLRCWATHKFPCTVGKERTVWKDLWITTP